jgi:hypothetical protein
METASEPSNVCVCACESRPEVLFIKARQTCKVERGEVRTIKATKTAVRIKCGFRIDFEINASKSRVIGSFQSTNIEIICEKTVSMRLTRSQCEREGERERENEELESDRIKRPNKRK